MYTLTEICEEIKKEGLKCHRVFLHRIVEKNNIKFKQEGYVKLFNERQKNKIKELYKNT